MLYSFDAVTADPNMGEVQIIVMPSCESPQGEILAVANEGYRFAHWSDGNTNAQRTIVVTSDITLTAYFEVDDGTENIDDVDGINAKVMVVDGRIVVTDTDGLTVTLYDAAGRQLAMRHNEGTPMQFDVPASGTYLVKVGNAPARRIVVVR